MPAMTKYRIYALLVLIIGAALAYFVYSSETNADSQFKFKYGLDLNGGTHLVYRANVEGIQTEDINDAMDVLRQTIEKRVNVFGVSEPNVQVETGSSFGDSKDKHRLIVELPGITDTEEAIAMIGQTPLLEFRLLKKDTKTEELQAKLLSASSSPEEISKIVLSAYDNPVLTGGNLKRSTLVFDATSRKPLVSLEFNDEGSKMFAQITKDNVGKELAIFLDGELISNPVIQQEIIGGTAQINGDFTAEEARDLVNNLNFGALPLPIELINTQTIGATLGQQTLWLGAKALLISIICISIFMIVFYRLPGIIAAVSLVIYTAIMLSLFKFIPVVLTSAGIAGFILSLGMAVDANVLIFERIKEELDNKKQLALAIKDGFDRAWSSIRDGNITSIIAAVILYWFSDVSLIKGFALVFGLGVIMSMVSAIFVSKTLLLGISKEHLGSFGRFLYSKGITNIKK
jgi:preprotein translocase subunit SecD